MLNVLHAQFGITLPEEVSFISSTKLALQGFSSAIDLALIRNKNETLDYVEGTYMLSEGKLFQITHRMDLEPIVDHVKRSELTEKLKTFVSKSLVACEQNQLIKEPFGQAKSFFTFTSQQENFLSSNGVDTSNADALLARAQAFAYEKKYDESRLFSLYILNKSPNYHDARILLARTFAWNAEYDTARYFLKQVLTRSPNYEDALIAAIDVAYWSGQHNDALLLSQKSSQEHDTSEMKARLARSLMMVGRKPEAKEILLHLLQVNPDHELSRTLLAQIEL
jgi:tetratricopeptide (TPR) repeat protein